MEWWKYIITFVVSYMIGNVSVARIISGIKKSDITKLGSGNPGTNNMLRNFGFKIGLINFILDVLKGFIPAFCFHLLFGGEIILYVAGVGAIVGHIYPVVYKFKGGKGIATMIGMFFAVDPIVTLIVIGVALVSWLLFKYGVIASFICVVSLTVYEGIWAQTNLSKNESMVVCLLLYSIFLLTWFAHRSNIQRLLYGKENKVDLLKSTKKKIKNK